MDMVYNTTPTGRDFHLSDSFIRTIIGPIGSGKSVACCIEIFKKCCEQKPFFGKRLSRWVIIRNTYRELIDTTMRTWFDWIPERLGLMRKQDMEFVMEFSLGDGTTVKAQILFRALDRPNDIKKLLSLELTGGWINEVREIPKAVLDMLVGRVGRYPSKHLHGGPSWWGVIMDTNPPDSDHWYFTLFEENLPENASIHHQPSGLSEDAENVENLPANYYTNMMLGKDPEWVKVYVRGEYGFVSDGLPIYPEFHDNVHVTSTEIDFKGDTLYIGVDFGRTPAAVFAQEIAGQIQVVDELVTFGIGATHFAQLLSERIHGHYPKNIEVVATGDPAGDNPGEQIDETCIEILQNAGIPIDPAHTNNFTIRREAVAIPLTRLTMRGEPQLVISPQCVTLRKACNGGYRYKRMQVSGEEFKQKPDKNKFSHVAEALQYLLLGMGRGYDVISSSNSIGEFKVKRAV